MERAVRVPSRFRPRGSAVFGQGGEGGGGGSSETFSTLFSSSLVSTLVPQSYSGSSTPTIVRATTAYQTDFEAKLNSVLSGEARFQGARRVRNNIGSIDISTWTANTATVTAGQSDPVGGTAAYKVTGSGADSYVIKPGIALTINAAASVWLRSDDVTAFNIGIGGTDTNFNITSTWTRYQASRAGDSGGSMLIGGASKLGSGKSVYIYFPQFESTVGQSNVAASELVDPTVDYGAGIVGTKYFTTLNGNTVASNVVTEATGAAIRAGVSGVSANAPVDANGPLGYLPEGARTNLCLRSQEFDNTTPWGLNGGATVTANTTVAPDGTTTADTLSLTASANDGIGGATSMGASSVQSVTGSVWAKMASGTGAFRFNLAVAGVANHFSSDQTVTTTWQRFTFTVTHEAGGQMVMVIQNGSDGAARDIIIWGAQFEAGAAFVSTYIPTTTVAVTRNAEIDAYATSGNINAAAGAIYMEISPNHAPSGTVFFWGTYVDADNYTALLHDATNLIMRKRIGGANKDATIELTFASGTVYKVAGSWGAGGVQVALSGTAGTPDADTAAAQIGTTMQFGADGNSVNQPFAQERNARIYATQPSSAQLAAMTA